MIGALDGIRVLDVTVNVAGPFATQILGDLGADVVKVERPGSGDDTRGWGPPFWNGESATFLSLNRNKRSLALDLRSDDGRAVLRELMGQADVVVQNLRPGALARLGFAYDDVAAENPGVIWCDLSGFGPAGPKAASPAYDPLMQAYAGLMSLTGEAGGPPARIPVSILDQGSGMWVAIGVLAALLRRAATGEGAHLTTSLLSTALQWLPAQLIGYFADGTVPRRLGSGTVGIYPYAAFPTRDEHIVVAAGNQSLWRKLCAAIEREDLAADPRFRENADRVTHREPLFEELARTLRTRDSAHWLRVLDDAGVPTAPIRSLDQVAQDEQVDAIGAIADVPHPRIDGLRLVNLPVRDGGAAMPVTRVPPQLGEHNDEILRALDEQRARMQERTP